MDSGFGYVSGSSRDPHCTFVPAGGSNNTVSLQPVSIEGGIGLNVSGGFASMSLTFQPS
jgi:hypothetical protein